MPNRLVNPYADARGTWVRGSFHGHCREHSGCSSVPLAESVRDCLGILGVTQGEHGSRHTGPGQRRAQRARVQSAVHQKIQDRTAGPVYAGTPLERDAIVNKPF